MKENISKSRLILCCFLIAILLIGSIFSVTPKNAFAGTKVCPSCGGDGVIQGDSYPCPFLAQGGTCPMGSTPHTHKAEDVVCSACGGSGIITTADSGTAITPTYEDKVTFQTNLASTTLNVEKSDEQILLSVVASCTCSRSSGAVDCYLWYKSKDGSTWESLSGNKSSMYVSVSTVGDFMIKCTAVCDCLKSATSNILNVHVYQGAVPTTTPTTNSGEDSEITDEDKSTTIAIIQGLPTNCVEVQLKETKVLNLLTTCSCTEPNLKYDWKYGTNLSTLTSFPANINGNNNIMLSSLKEDSYFVTCFVTCSHCNATKRTNVTTVEFADFDSITYEKVTVIYKEYTKVFLFFKGWKEVYREDLVKGTPIKADGKTLFGDSFEDFSTDKNGKKVVDNTYTPKSSMTLYINYKKPTDTEGSVKTYKIRYYTTYYYGINTGLVNTLYETTEAFDGSVIKILSGDNVPSFTMNDTLYTFSYWSYDLMGNNAVSEDDVVTKNVKVYAQYNREIPEEVSGIEKVFKELDNNLFKTINAWWGFDSPWLNYVVTVLFLILCVAVIIAIVKFVIKSIIR